MDHIAQMHLHHTIENTWGPHIHGELWTVWIGTRKIGSKFKENLVDHVHTQQIFKWWGKWGFSIEDRKQVDWGANESALCAVPTSCQYWLTKYESGMCGVGKMIKIWGKQATDKCPHCGEWKTVPHVLAWQEEDAVKTFHDSIEILDQYIICSNAAPEICMIIKHVLLAWKRGDAYSPAPTSCIRVQEAIESQEQLG